MNTIEKALTDKGLTYHQKLAGLARLAESELEVLPITPEIQELRNKGIICDLFEGPAPYRPRYLAPDYRKFMIQGSDFLAIQPAQDIWEAVSNLLILYRHVPSITTYPVFLGHIDSLLEPYIENQKDAKKAIDIFLHHIDRTLNDSFCHANIGPKTTAASRMILDSTLRQQNPVPNLTLRYDSKETDRDFAREAVRTSLGTAKPSFANHGLFSEEFSTLGAEDYCIASCYNGLPVGGGSYTLVRLNLKKLAENCSDLDDFWNRGLPGAVQHQLEYMDMRVKFLAEKSGFFDSSFLVQEGLIQKERLTGMFGVVGLAELVDTLGNRGLFGIDPRANDLGLEIIQTIDEKVKSHLAPHCSFGQSHYLLHAQVGIDIDSGVSPGCRIPIGREPDLPNHILQSAPFHKYFPSGIGDVFAFDPTVKRNPDYLLDIIDGAFTLGMRYFSAYGADSDVVRITGYLVKRSEIEQLNRGEVCRHDTTVFGRNAVNNLRVLDRKLRT